MKIKFKKLSPYSTQTIEYYFYFPTFGEFTHYPVHAAKNEQIVAFTQPTIVKVVKVPSFIVRIIIKLLKNLFIFFKKRI